MLGLPKATELSKALPKKAIFERFKASPADRRLFDEQINRLSIVAEISPQTVALNASEAVSAVYVVLVTLKTAACDKRNITLLSKLIDQRMLFVLQFGESARLAVYRAGKVLMSEPKLLADWQLRLTGLDLEAVWENAIAQIGGIEIEQGNTLDEQIAIADRRVKNEKELSILEKWAQAERQPKRKMKLAQEIAKLKLEMREDR